MYNILNYATARGMCLRKGTWGEQIPLQCFLPLKKMGCVRSKGLYTKKKKKIEPLLWKSWKQLCEQAYLPGGITAGE